MQSSEYEILSTDASYISNIDVEDFETAEFIIIPKVKNPRLIFSLNYKDNNNQDYSESKKLTLNVYTLEEAKQLGLVKNNLLLTISITVVILLLIYFIYRKFKKKKI